MARSFSDSLSSTAPAPAVSSPFGVSLLPERDLCEAAVWRVSLSISADPSLPVDIVALCVIAEMTPLHLERAFHLCQGVSMTEYARREWERQRARGMARPWLIAAI
jgi:hypothetical protein